jgi:pimeloyl-ACP methyl ester carboxylesterase
MLIPLVLLILLFPISVLSQSYDCPEQKQITVEKTFTRVGEKLTIPIDLKPCEEISVDEYHQFSDPNTGTLLIFRYLNRDGETIIEQSYSATGAWRGLNFPDRAPEPFPFQASVGTKELPATLEIESSTAIGKSPSYKFTIKRSPRYNHNIGGTDFKSAKEFTTLPSTFYGSLREDDGGQFFKVRLESEESLHFSGFSEANQRYGGGMHISIYNSRTENLFPTFANGWWLYNPDYGVRRFEKTFKNPYKSAENFYIKVGSWPFHVYNFSINLSLQKNAKQKPVVFIPGIAGSTLNTKGGDTLWPVGLSTDLSDLTLDPAKRPWRTIVSNDIVRKVMGFKDVYGEFINSLRNMGGFVEYDYRRDPRLRTAEGCDLSQKSKIPELFAFPYDWRKSNKESLSSLDQYLQCVQKFYPDTKVDLVAHSMGGVLARRYIMEYGGRQNIGRLITINTPWLGAPKAINVLFTGEFFDSVFDYLFMSRIRELTEYFQGVHELIPSRWYFGLGGRPIAVEKGQGTSDLSYEEMVRYLDDRFSFSRPGTAGMSFHDVPGQDDARGDKSGKYLSIYSLQKAGTTPSKVIQEKYAKCLSLEFGFRCKEQNRYRLERCRHF